jgi:hypothetical protein
MKKVLTTIILALVLFGAGMLIGMNIENKNTLAAIDIENRSARPIMTAIVNHEQGSAVAANIKKSRTQRVRFFTKGQNHYTIRVTFDDNRTVYSQARRSIKNGETAREIVDDSTITADNR